MPRLSIWDSGRKSADYRFIDRSISEFFGIGGTAVWVHLYLGPYQQEYPMTSPDGTTVPAFDPDHPLTVTSTNNTIQDVLFLENRDRHYADDVYELRGVYNVNDLDYDLRQFGLFLQSDTLWIEFHLNDMVEQLGRRIMPGDVLELPHRRDDTITLDAKAMNKYYVVEDASRAANGYSATWFPHIWRVRVAPMPASQEYQDILNQQSKNPLGLDEGKIGDLISTMGNDLAINEQVVEDAKANVKKRYFETRQFWMVTPEASGHGSYPWVFCGDGIPPNGAIPLGTGHRFPESPLQGDYYLRTDYKPATLFMWDAGAWRMQEQDIRGPDWTAAHNLLLSFINDTNTVTFEDGTTGPERVYLSQAVKPRADF
jgi:hypothetical protein